MLGHKESGKKKASKCFLQLALCSVLNSAYLVTPPFGSLTVPLSSRDKNLREGLALLNDWDVLFMLFPMMFTVFGVRFPKCFKAPKMDPKKRCCLWIGERFKEFSWHPRRCFQVTILFSERLPTSKATSTCSWFPAVVLPVTISQAMGAGETASLGSTPSLLAAFNYIPTG